MSYSNDPDAVAGLVKPAAIHQGTSEQEPDNVQGLFNGASEVSMRGQFRAWRRAILSSMQLFI